MTAANRIAVWLTHPQVACWNFSAADSRLLQHLLPNCHIRQCNSEAEFLQALPETEIAVVWRFKQDYFRHCPNLRWIATPAAGQDYFQVEAPPAVRMTYGSFHGPLIAETVLAMILGHCRGIFTTMQLQAEHPWPRPQLSDSMTTLHDASVTILGFGNIGQAIGRLLKPFGPALTGIRRHPNGKPPDYFGPLDRMLPVDQLDKVLPTTKHLVLVLPRNTETDRIIDARRLASLPPDAAIYNVGRGNAIDEDALARQLQAGKLARACLDVFAHEPLPADSPLRNCQNILLMPHASAINPRYMPLFCHELAGLLNQA